MALAAIFLLAAIRSLMTWARTDFEAASPGEHVLYALHVTARVGLWFAFASIAAGFAFLDEPQRFRWFGLVPLFLAGVQLITGMVLAQGPSVRGRAPGNGRGMDRTGAEAGPLEPEKSGQTAEPGTPQPEASEVESARLLANQARDRLEQEGLSETEIRRLADEFVAQDLGEDLDTFVEWARGRGRDAG